MLTNLQPFQKRFLKNALKPGIQTACLSVPRGQGKSSLAAHVLERCLTPGDPLHEPGKEYVLLSGSLEQARTVFRIVRAALEPTGEYRWTDGTTAIGCVHLASGTRLKVRSSSGKTLMGLLGVPLLIFDECGAVDVVGGQLLHDSIQGAMGKPGSPLKALYVSTIAPSFGGWWADMIKDGSAGSTYVQAIQGDPAKWRSLREILRCNPLAKHDPVMRARLIEERIRPFPIRASWRRSFRTDSISQRVIPVKCC